MKKILPANLKQGILSFLVLLILLFQFVTISFAQVKFSAVCPNNQIGKNEYLQVQYVVENAASVDQISPPSFKDFILISGPNQQSSTSIVNGNIKQSVALEFILKPLHTGNYVLAPATAKVNGKTMQSNSLSVQVTNNSTGPSSGGTSISPFGNMMTDVIPASPVLQYDDYILHKGENLNEKIKRNLFLKVDVSKTSCYVGEPIVATYKLYTRLKSESNLTKSPSFNGFSVSEMEMPDNYTLGTEKYNGREYTVYILRKVQLYPLQAGTVALDPVEVENNITFIKAEYAEAKRGDIFYDMLKDFVDATTPPEGMEHQKVSLQSKPVAIVVKPLPETDKPQNFRGAVGKFNLSASLEKNYMSTDEAGNLNITISGNGNMQMVNAPNIQWPDGIEAFDPKSAENINKTTIPLKGEKTFNYAFTVAKPGTYQIPSITFSYFDIVKHSYKTIETEPLKIEVKKGTGIRPAIANSGDNNKPGNVQSKFWNWPLLLSIAVFLILAFITFFTIRLGRKKATMIAPVPDKNVTEKQAEPEKNEEAHIYQNPLLEAEQMLSDNAVDFYSTLNKCVRKYLSLKLNYPEKELSKKKINELLDKQNVDVNTTLMLCSLLENIELNLYAPLSSANEMQHEYAKASEVISLLDKQVFNQP